MKKQYPSVKRLNQYELGIERFNGLRTCCISFPFILPCLSAGVAWFGTLLMYGTSDKEMMGYMAIAGLGAGLLLFLIFFPTICLKRTATPSGWQRFCRFYQFTIIKYIFILIASPWLLLFLKNQSKESKQQEEKLSTYFKYWLSHPDEEPSPEQCEKIVQVDTSKFDWQDPNQWPNLSSLPDNSQ